MCVCVCVCCFVVECFKSVLVAWWSSALCLSFGLGLGLAGKRLAIWVLVGGVRSVCCSHGCLLTAKDVGVSWSVTIPLRFAIHVLIKNEDPFCCWSGSDPSALNIPNVGRAIKVFLHKAAPEAAKERHGAPATPTPTHDRNEHKAQDPY